MDDLISRQMAILEYQRMCRGVTCKDCPFHVQVTDSLTDCKLERFIHKLPSVQSEIIHCKDCKHYKAYEYTGTLACHYVIGCTVKKEPDDFCSRAERITDG